MPCKPLSGAATGSWGTAYRADSKVLRGVHPTMVIDTVQTECPRCETVFDRIPEVDRHEMPGIRADDSLFGGDVTCNRCGTEFEVYFYP